MSSPATINRDMRGLIWILLLALFLRLSALFFCPFIGTDGGVDGVAMSVAGANLIKGEGFHFQGRPETIHAPLMPWLIGLTCLLTGNLEISGILVSALAGTLLIIPLFFLSRCLVGKSAAHWAALLGAVFPPYIFSATEVRVAGLYSCLFLFFCWALYKTGKKPSPSRGVVMGLVLGLAYLARPEALILWPLAVFLLLASCWGNLLSSLKKILGALLGAGAGFVFLGLPYWFFLHRHLGIWTLSARAPFTFIPYFSPDWEEANFQAYAYPEKIREAWNTLGGYPGLIREHGQDMGERFIHNLASLLRMGDSPEFSRMGIPSSLISVLFVIGLALFLFFFSRRLFKKRAGFGDLFILVMCLPMLPYFFLTDFMTSQKLRYLFPYLAFGLIGVSAVLARWRPFPQFSWAGGKGLGMILFVVMLVTDAWLIPAKKGMVPWEFKLMGNWMKNNLEGVSRSMVMSQRFGVPFYAGAGHIETPPGLPVRVRKYARETGADYLVVCDWTTPSRRPELAFLLEGPAPFWLDRVHEIKWQNNRVVLYRFKPEGKR